MTNKHIIEVFIHEDEAKSEKEIKEIVIERVKKHALNAISLLKGQNELQKNAVMGLRQGKKDIGPI